MRNKLGKRNVANEKDDGVAYYGYKKNIIDQNRDYPKVCVNLQTDVR